MSELKFQQAFARFLTDSKFRESILGGNTQVLEEFSLSAEEQQRLLQLDRDRVQVFAELLIVNRLSKAIDGLPWTTKLLGSRLWPSALAFNQASPPKHSKKYREALAFGQFLKAHFRRQPPTPPFLEDVLNYEISALELRFQSNGGEASGLAAETLEFMNGVYTYEASLDLVPYRLSHTRTLSLNYDMESIGEEIARGRTPRKAKKRPMHILLRTDFSGVLSQDEINIPTLLFIEACDGRAPLREIVASLSWDFHQSPPTLDFTQRCFELCKSLIERDVIAFKLH